MEQEKSEVEELERVRQFAQRMIQIYRKKYDQEKKKSQRGFYFGQEVAYHSIKIYIEEMQKKSGASAPSVR